jgi:hypothetical protein
MTLYDQNPNLDYTLDLDVAGPIPSPARTEKQIHASRVNGSKSRGPVTPEGKAISSRNTAFNDATARPYPRNAHSKTGVYGQHGMLAKVILLEGESLEIFREFMHSLEATWQPVGPIEDSFLEIMALAQWRRMRLLGMERAGFNHQIAIETELDPATCAFLAFTTPCRAEPGYRAHVPLLQRPIRLRC